MGNTAEFFCRLPAIRCVFQNMPPYNTKNTHYTFFVKRNGLQPRGGVLNVTKPYNHLKTSVTKSITVVYLVYTVTYFLVIKWGGGV